MYLPPIIEVLDDAEEMFPVIFKSSTLVVPPSRPSSPIISSSSSTKYNVAENVSLVVIDQGLLLNRCNPCKEGVF